MYFCLIEMKGLFWKRLDWGYICHIIYSGECFSGLGLFFKVNFCTFKTHDSLPQKKFSNAKEIALTWHLWEITSSWRQFNLSNCTYLIFLNLAPVFYYRTQLCNWTFDLNLRYTNRRQLTGVTIHQSPM